MKLQSYKISIQVGGYRSLENNAKLHFSSQELKPLTEKKIMLPTKVNCMWLVHIASHIFCFAKE